MKKLDGKVAIITGGASGMGKATAIKFANEGAKVVVADFNEENGNNTINEIKSSGGEASFFKVDVSQWDQVNAMVDFAVDTYGSLDVIWNNAGISESYPLLNCNIESYERTIQINQHGVAYGIFAAAKKMVELGVKGVIINTASVFGEMGFATSFAYGASKAAIDNMTKTAALELGEYGIRVVAIAPGTVKTPIIKDVLAMGYGETLKKYHMRQKLIEPEAIANVIAFLASEDSDVINGIIIPVDDGWTSFKSF